MPRGRWAGMSPLTESQSRTPRPRRDRGNNDFAGHEPGSETEIASFCSTQYNVQYVTDRFWPDYPVHGPFS